MAKAGDIDTQAAVRKYLERKTVVDKEDESSNASEEITALLESIALAFILNPQVALVFVLRAKNVLQQVLVSDLALLDYLVAAVRDVQNPNEPINDVSDILEAQIALVEVGRVGKLSGDIRAYDRYDAAIARFLDNQLGKYLKRRRQDEFERSGPEAKQDLYRILAAFVAVHEVMEYRLSVLAGSVSDFNSIDLTRLIVVKTVTRVRASLSKILNGLTKGITSKTSAAVELLTGAASLRAISSDKNIYAALLDTGAVPAGRVIRAFSEPVAARAVGVAGPVDLSLAASLDFEVDSSPLSAPFPLVMTLPDASYLISRREDNTQPFTIPVTGRTLYIQFDGPVPVFPDPVMVIPVVLTTGTQTAAFVAAEIDAAISAVGTSVEWGSTGKILIMGLPAVTKITIRDNLYGTYDGVGNYTPADASVHALFGFTPGQESSEPSIFSPESLYLLLESSIPEVEVFLEDERVVIQSTSTDIDSGLLFTGEVAAAFGFDGLYVPEPSYLVLQEGSVGISPGQFGIQVGSLITVSDVLDTSRSLRDPVWRIEGDRLYFDPLLPIPRVAGADVTALSPLVDAAQTVVSICRSYVGKFSQDNQSLQRVLSPLLSRPTLAQINDALKALTSIQSKVAGLKAALEAVVVSEERNEYSSVSKNILLSLEERNLDRAAELLLQASFTEFFSLTRDTASKSGRLMRAAEDLVRGYFPVSTEESLAQEITSTGSNDEAVLQDAEDSF